MKSFEVRDYAAILDIAWVPESTQVVFGTTNNQLERLDIDSGVRSVVASFDRYCLSVDCLSADKFLVGLHSAGVKSIDQSTQNWLIRDNNLCFCKLGNDRKHLAVLTLGLTMFELLDNKIQKSWLGKVPAKYRNFQTDESSRRSRAIPTLVEFIGDEYVVTGYNSGLVAAFAASNGDLIFAELFENNSFVAGMKAIGNNKFAYSVDQGCASVSTIEIEQNISRNVLIDIPVGDEQSGFSAIDSNKDKLVGVVGVKGVDAKQLVFCLDLPSGDLHQAEVFRSHPLFGVNCLAISPCGAWIAFGTWSSQVVILSMEELLTLDKLPPNELTTEDSV